MKNLPEKPNFDHLRRQAKDLFKAWKSGHPETLQELQTHFNPLPASPKLADAQFALAQQYGFDSWPKLKAHIESLNPTKITPDEWVAEVVRKHQFPQPLPTWKQENIFVAAALADPEALQTLLSKNPDLANARGPMKITPLIALTQSRAPQKDPIASTKILLQHRANPKLTFEDPAYPGDPLSPLFGAVSITANPTVTQLLIDAGAEVNDGESLYHSVETDQIGCLQALLKANIDPRKTNALYRALDYDRLEPVQLLLEYGTDPNEILNRPPNENTIFHAIRRGRNLPFIKLLVEHKVDLTAVSKEGWNILSTAKRRSDPQTIDYLESIVQQNNLSLPKILHPETEDYVTAVTQNHLEKANQLLAQNPDLPKKLPLADLHILIDCAWANELEKIKRLVEYGWIISPPKHMLSYFVPTTPLHIACFNGNLQLAQFCIDQNADLNLVESQYKASPIQFAAWSANFSNHNLPGNIECIQLLLHHGAQKPKDWPKGNDEIDALLED